jgi:hypothetical protein
VDDSENCLVPRHLRVALVAVAALAATGVLAATASAALFLVFSRTSAAPGETVSVRTGGHGALKLARLYRDPVRVFMAPVAEAESITSPRDWRLTLVGRLTIDRKGDGRVRFVTPNLPPGDYTTLFHCPHCWHAPPEGLMAPAGPYPGPFRITPVERTCTTTQWGDLGDGWQQRAARAGPLAVYPVPAAAPARAPGTTRAFRPIKLIVILDGAVDATLVVPAEERPHVGLLYARHGPFGVGGPAVRVRDGVSAVTFGACPESTFPQVQYGGYFVVDEPRCAHLLVRVEGRPEPLPLAVPFGRPC